MVPLLSEEEVRRMNEEVKRDSKDYTAEERAKIGKYAAENGPARAVRHFSKVLDRKLPKRENRQIKIPPISIFAQSAKYNSRQYFRLYGNSLLQTARD